jgi:cyclopropane-fatty-acyl-phospholipid synthase
MHVTAATMSRKQLEFARERLRRAGLADRATAATSKAVMTISCRSRWSKRWANVVGPTTSRHQSGMSPPAARHSFRQSLSPTNPSRPIAGIPIHPDLDIPRSMLQSREGIVEQCRRAALEVAELHGFGLDYAHMLETWLGRFDRVTDHGTIWPIVPQPSPRDAPTFCRHTSNIYKRRQSRRCPNSGGANSRKALGCIQD